jgi:hypothetical protein
VVIVGALVAGCAADDNAPDAATASTATAGEATAPGTEPTATPASSVPATSAADGPPPLTPADRELVDAVEFALGTNPPGCDPLDTRHCLFPFPSDHVTEADPSTVTGRRVALPAQSIATNSSGVPVEETAWNERDGFSPNTPLLTWVEGLDVENTPLPDWTDLGASLDDDATVVVVDTVTGERVPLWVDDASDVSGTLLTIRPAISLENGREYAAGVRGLLGGDGVPLPSSPVFQAYRDRLDTGLPVVEDRRASMESTIAALDDAGIERDELQLAWGFTTASTQNTAGRILAMREETLAGLEDAAPEYEITTVTDAPSPGVARFVEGRFSVPNYLTGDGGPGSSLSLDGDGVPQASGVVKAPFACVIPDAVVDSGRPAHLVQYGHGLLGSHFEVGAGDVVAMADEYEAVYCATSWTGFSEDDTGTAVATLRDLSVFPAFVDRMHQGLLDQMVLTKLMLADNGLISEPEFRRADGSPLIDNSSVVYDGNSQGGIMGMALAALSPDLGRAVLGVVGMNYSTLLPRSVDFDVFETIFEPAYPDPLDRALAIAVLQTLWDRAEGAGYVRHIVDDPLPGTPEKDVLLHVAFGDWQVSELTAMNAARTMGVPIHRPVTAPGRSREVEPGWGIATLGVDDSSALVIWDSGSDPIPVGDTPPSTSRDPHGDPRNDRDVRRQKAAFLFDGELIDVCAAGPCTADPS